MAFVPFLAIDNHKRSVVVGSSLIAGENIENFKWVLSAFLKCYKKQPTIVITDQCSAMRQAVPCVFNESKHRFCIWHIMKKVPKKVCTHNHSGSILLIFMCSNFLWLIVRCLLH